MQFEIRGVFLRVLKTYRREIWVERQKVIEISLFFCLFLNLFGKSVWQIISVCQGFGRIWPRICHVEFPRRGSGVTRQGRTCHSRGIACDAFWWVKLPPTGQQCSSLRTTTTGKWISQVERNPQKNRNPQANKKPVNEFLLTIAVKAKYLLVYHQATPYFVEEPVRLRVNSALAPWTPSKFLLCFFDKKCGPSSGLHPGVVNITTVLINLYFFASRWKGKPSRKYKTGHIFPDSIFFARWFGQQVGFSGGGAQQEISRRLNCYIATNCHPLWSGMGMRLAAQL